MYVWNVYHYDEGRRAWGEDALFYSSSLYPHLNIYVSVIMYVCMYVCMYACM